MAVLTNLKHYFDVKNILNGDQSHLLELLADKSIHCLLCNGYYGPSFNEPFCATCHIFLYPDMYENSLDTKPLNTLSHDNKSDSEDSGNEDLGPGTGSFGLLGSNTSPLSEDDDDEVEELPDSNSGRNVAGSSFGPNRGRLAEQIAALTCPRSGSCDTVPPGTLNKIPSEVLAAVFKMLDDLSCWCCSQVCKRWLNIIKSETTASDWEKFVRTRFPVFQPFVVPICWFKTYGRIVRSTNCLQCLHQIFANYNPRSGPNNLGSKRIVSELKSIQMEPPEGVEARPLTQCCTQWCASILGPVNSPYEGGKFFLFIRIPTAYPMRAPEIKFLTRIVHPNISRHGDIGLDVLVGNWCPSLTIGKILLSIQSLLNDPNTAVCMEPVLGKLYNENRDIYNAVACSATWKFAMVETVDFT